MTTSDYARKLTELIEVRPKNIDLDKLLYEVYVRAKLAEAEQDISQGRWSTHEQVMERMWEKIHSKFDGRNGRKMTSKKSSPRLLEPKRKQKLRERGRSQLETA